MLDDAGQAVGQAIAAGQTLVLVGETAGWLGQSLWLREIAGREDGPPPPIDLAAERRNGDFVRGQILSGAVRACHDVSDGGLLIAVAEMALAGNTGVALNATGDHGFWFGEDQGRYVLAVDNAAAVLAAAAAANVPAVAIGVAQGQGLTVPGIDPISLSEARAANDRFFPAWMN